MKNQNTESRVNGIINLRALMQDSLKSQRVGRTNETTKANEGLFCNRVLYPVHFPNK